MKKYKLTCIKDMPGVEKGFSYSFSEKHLLEGIRPITYDAELDKKIYSLFYNRNNEDFVKKEIDLDYAVKELKCPKCGRESLFTSIINRERYTCSCDVYKWYDDTGLECGICGWQVKLSSVCTETKVQ